MSACEGYFGICYVVEGCTPIWLSEQWLKSEQTYKFRLTLFALDGSKTYPVDQWFAPDSQTAALHQAAVWDSNWPQ